MFQQGKKLRDFFQRNQKIIRPVKLVLYAFVSFLVFDFQLYATTGRSLIVKYHSALFFMAVMGMIWVVFISPWWIIYYRKTIFTRKFLPWIIAVIMTVVGDVILLNALVSKDQVQVRMALESATRHDGHIEIDFHDADMQRAWLAENPASFQICKLGGYSFARIHRFAVKNKAHYYAVAVQLRDQASVTVGSSYNPSSAWNSACESW